MSDDPPDSGAVTPAVSLDLPHGSCVGIAIPEVITTELRSALHAEELRHLETLSLARQPSFAAGRVALRLAMARARLGGAEAQPVLIGVRGQPLLPPGVSGSISHKRTLAVALAAATTLPSGAPGDIAVGIDLEENRRLSVDISRRVLTEGEIARWMDISSPLTANNDRDRALITLFSLKEAVYKAVNPFLQRFVSWRAVEVTSIDPQGGVRFSGTLLDDNPNLALEGWVGCPSERFILSSARACWRARG